MKSDVEQVERQTKKMEKEGIPVRSPTPNP
jgi:hypothetical protein